MFGELITIFRGLGSPLPLAGKYLPFLHAEGLSAFKLKIYKLSGPQFKSIDALYLEQYHLLAKEHELNSLKVVNGGPILTNRVNAFIYTI